MTRKMETEEVKNLKEKEITEGYEFANKCLMNSHMKHDREVLIHNAGILEKPYWSIMDSLEELW